VAIDCTVAISPRYALALAVYPPDQMHLNARHPIRRLAAVLQKHSPGTKTRWLTRIGYDAIDPLPPLFIHVFLFLEGHTMQDLSTYSLAKLRALEVQVIEELKTRHFLSVSKAREQILHIAQSAGISVKDLMSGKSAARAKSAPAGAKYRNPDDASQEWSGRGRQPNWIKAWTASGKSIEDTKI
jgi:DNA-binding protein H-NS